MTSTGAALAGWAARAGAATAAQTLPPLPGNRFLTFNTVIQVNHITVGQAFNHTPIIRVSTQAK